MYVDKDGTVETRDMTFKEKAQVKWDNFKCWCSDHKEQIVVFGPVIIGGVVEVIKIAAKRGNVNEEKNLKERYIYDRSQGHYYELKRKPKSSEWIQIDQRKSEGEHLGNILRDMRLLK